ncbi:efflux RND transporter periplasmic adaptor subunit [Novispirillum sp. DQ9]|uniref:efflux RND transporter periplasmic adaptor subunit n=1 Tax=Novispirillum sp. DQ9 TaxID=3398612 RepID=UPI003C7ADF02
MLPNVLRRYGRRLLVVPPLLLAVVILVVATKGRPAPERLETAEVARPARVVAVPRLDLVPRVTAHGTVVPGRTWDAVAEVAGRVLEVHPELRNGAILPAGTVLARIDPSAAELALAQVEAQLRELDIRERNTRKSLEIERRTLTSLRRDQERKKTLGERGAAAQSSIDTAERAVLQGEQQVQSLENSLSTLPQERAVLEARRADAARDVARTVIAAPFDIRVRELAVEVDQYAARGQVLARADGIKVAEVAAQVPLDRLWTLLPPGADAPPDMSKMAEILGIDPVVRLTAGDLTVDWPARVARVAETVDPRTRTVGVIVAVDDPYTQARPGERPPLTRSMFVEVELRGRPRAGSLVIPREALRRTPGGQPVVWVLDAQDRLRTRPVDVAFRQDGLAVLRDGVAEGERVVLSDLIPAVEGMLVRPVPDEAAAARLSAQALGTAP